MTLPLYPSIFIDPMQFLWDDCVIASRYLASESCPGAGLWIRVQGALVKFRPVFWQRSDPDLGFFFPNGSYPDPMLTVLIIEDWKKKIMSKFYWIGSDPMVFLSRRSYPANLRPDPQPWSWAVIMGPQAGSFTLGKWAGCSKYYYGYYYTNGQN